MFQITVLVTLLFFRFAVSDFTFRNVMVTCDSENPLEDQFGTIVTTNRLKPHLPNNQRCYKISVQYANIPILHKDSVSEITNANYLLLENDNIEELDAGAFAGTELKEALSLKSNKIREVRRGVFNNVQVPVLLLSYNFISYIDYQAFNNMTKLESIHLDHNRLSRIDIFWFRQTPKLNQINLQSNIIQELPANAFQSLFVEKSVKSSVDLSQNLIRVIDRDAFAGNKKLHHLNLAHNKLEDLPRTWLKGAQMDILDVSSNRIRCLRYGLAASPSTNLIDGNPWDCNCLEELLRKREFGSVVADAWAQKCNIRL